MNGRVAALLALSSVREVLQESDLVDVLGDVVPMSEDYIPALQFLMRPDNRLLEAPTDAKLPIEPGQMPTYDEYAVVYRAHWILCSSSFSMQLIAAMIALKDEPRRSICALLLQFNSRDTMTLEAFTRFVNTFMDQYSPDLLLAFFEPSEQVAFAQTLLVLVVYEPMRDVVLRICNEVAEDKLDVGPLLGVLLFQLSPHGLLATEHAASAIVSPVARERVALDQPHERFSRMVFSCDLLTDLIHEGRDGSFGFALVRELATNDLFGRALLDAVLFDLAALPTAFANESYTIKVLNSLLQQTQCGCVAKAGEGKSVPETGSESATFTHESPHENLPLLWKVFLSRLPEVLAFLTLPPNTHFKTTHMQLVYLMLPVLNVACSVADSCVVHARAMEALMGLMARFPDANILHCAISRLFIVALEDSPFMFGKELPAYRTATDSLRMHLLLNGAFQLVLDVFDSCKARSEGRRSPPPAFLDIAISFDQAVTNAHASSAHAFDACASLLDRWQDFRVNVLLPTQTVWEEQYQVSESAAASGVDNSPRGPESAQVEATLTRELPGDGQSLQAPLATDVDAMAKISVLAGPELNNTLDAASILPVGPSVTVVSAAGAVDVPTPLSALYSDEEKRLMLRVSTAGDT